MPDFLTISPWLGALIIFVLRVINIAMDTLRVMLTMRNMKGISWILGFFETILFVIAMGAVLDNLNNILYIVAYSAGFATGNVVGMEIEKRLALGYSQISIISRAHGKEIAQALRENDFLGLVCSFSLHRAMQQQDRAILSLCRDFRNRKVILAQRLCNLLAMGTANDAYLGIA